MIPERFSDLVLLHIEGDLISKLSVKKIADIYANQKKGTLCFTRSLHSMLKAQARLKAAYVLRLISVPTTFAYSLILC